MLGSGEMRMRCRHCGIAGHDPKDCPLKKQGDKELADEARRRQLRDQKSKLTGLAKAK
jgi:hypothetical protein